MIEHFAAIAMILGMGAVTANLRARDGDVMAPGAARLVYFHAEGKISVQILEREYRGQWQSVTIDRLRLLPQHWRGRSGELRTMRLVKAELSGPLSTLLECELAIADDAPAGVCDDQSRLYYLQRK